MFGIQVKIGFLLPNTLLNQKLLTQNSRAMKTQLLKYTLSCMFVLLLSGWTVVNAQATVKHFCYNDPVTFTMGERHPCLDEIVVFSGNLHGNATTVTNGNTTNATGHWNYQGVSGIGQTSGDTYLWIEQNHFNNNAWPVALSHVDNRRIHIIHIGGADFYLNYSFQWTVNANGDYTHSVAYTEQECE